MIIGSLFAFLIPVMTGLLIVYLSWPDQSSVFKNPLLKFSLAIGIGFGISSLCFFIWAIILGPKNGFVPCVMSELLLLTVLSSVALRDAKKKTVPQMQDYCTHSNSVKRQLLYKILLNVTCITLAMTVVSFICKSLKEPHGSWDAWAIWNLHARFLFRGDLDWRNVFIIYWAQPDYPFLIPGLIARCWEFIGKEIVWIPAITAMFFTFGTVGVIISSLSMLKGRTEGLLGGLMLMGTPFFIKLGAAQYADVPLSFFFCSALALFSIIDYSYHDREKLLPLAGLMAAFSAWTKNEGTMFLFSLMAARFIVVMGFRGFKAYFREIKLLMIGIMPVALILVYFKLYLAPPNDLFTGNVLARLTNFSRCFYILKASRNLFMRFGVFYIGAIVLLLLPTFMSGAAIKKKDIPVTLTLFITLSFMACSYFLAYLITPHELNWHLSTSLDRLFLQLGPGTILLILFLFKSTEEIGR